MPCKKRERCPAKNGSVALQDLKQTGNRRVIQAGGRSSQAGRRAQQPGGQAGRRAGGQAGAAARRARGQAARQAGAGGQAGRRAGGAYQGRRLPGQAVTRAGGYQGRRLPGRSAQAIKNPALRPGGLGAAGL